MAQRSATVRHSAGERDRRWLGRSALCPTDALGGIKEVAQTKVTSTVWASVMAHSQAAAGLMDSAAR